MTQHRGRWAEIKENGLRFLPNLMNMIVVVLVAYCTQPALKHRKLSTATAQRVGHGTSNKNLQ